MPINRNALLAPISARWLLRISKQFYLFSGFFFKDRLAVQLIDLLGRKQDISLSDSYRYATNTRVNLNNIKAGIYLLNLYVNGQLKKSEKLSVIK
ncbi:MAG: T9SS type A sorting domain-containing protein [Bacteroidetes bacterium]|nr:T9SS type A sorting domain-containing protein [Bacteroidota bacterium]